MDKLETIMQDRELVKKAVTRYLKDYYCPSEFGFKEYDPGIACAGEKNSVKCSRCWNEALKNQN